MRTIVISYEGFEETPEGDIRQFACEEHQITMTEDEQFLGVALLYQGDKHTEIPLSS